MGELETFFRQRYGVPPLHVTSTPAGLDLIGIPGAPEHGVTLSAAIDVFVRIACAPRNDGKCVLSHAAFPAKETFWADRLQRDPAAPWADFPKAVLLELRRRGLLFGGFDMAILDEIPAGAALNRFAPLMVCMLQAIRALSPYSITTAGGITRAGWAQNAAPSFDRRERLLAAGLCQQAAREFLGVDMRRTEFAGPALGKAWHLLSIDRDLATCDVLPFIGQVLVLWFDPGWQTSGTTSPLPFRHRLAAVARKLGLHDLRTLDRGALGARLRKLPEPEATYAQFAILETARGVAAETALRNDDYAQFGVYVTESGRAARALLRDRAPVASADEFANAATRGCGGARVLSSGAGTAVVQIVAHHQVEALVANLAVRQPGSLRKLVCQTVDAW